MNPKIIYFTVLQLAALSLIISCTNSEDQDEKNVITITTDRIAQDAVETIYKPIDKAKNVDVLSTDRTRDIKDAAAQE